MTGFFITIPSVTSSSLSPNLLLLAPHREAHALLPGSSRRPVDVYLLNWRGDRPAALNVLVISPMQQLTPIGAANTQGHTLQVGVNRKMNSKFSACHRAGITFIPMVSEVFGVSAQTPSPLFEPSVDYKARG